MWRGDIPSHCAVGGRFLIVEVRSSGGSSLLRSPGSCVATALLWEIGSHRPHTQRNRSRGAAVYPAVAPTRDFCCETTVRFCTAGLAELLGGCLFGYVGVVRLQWRSHCCVCRAHRSGRRHVRDTLRQHEHQPYARPLNIHLRRFQNTAGLAIASWDRSSALAVFAAVTAQHSPMRVSIQPIMTISAPHQPRASQIPLIPSAPRHSLNPRRGAGSLWW